MNNERRTPKYPSFDIRHSTFGVHNSFAFSFHAGSDIFKANGIIRTPGHLNTQILTAILSKDSKDETYKYALLRESDGEYRMMYDERRILK